MLVLRSHAPPARRLNEPAEITIAGECHRCDFVALMGQTRREVGACVPPSFWPQTHPRRSRGWGVSGPIGRIE